MPDTKVHFTLHSSIAQCPTAQCLGFVMSTPARENNTHRNVRETTTSLWYYTAYRIYGPRFFPTKIDHIQSWPKKFVLGCVISPLLRQAESRNLGHTFLANSVGCWELAYLASMQQPLHTANIGIWQKIPHSGGTVTSIVPVRQNGISSFSLSSAPAPFFPRERANRPQRFPQSPSDVSSFNIPPPPRPS